MGGLLVASGIALDGTEAAVPELRQSDVQFSFVEENGLLHYRYRIVNGATSDAAIRAWAIALPAAPDPSELATEDLFTSAGGRNRAWRESAAQLGLEPTTVTPAGCTAAVGWNCTLGRPDKLRWSSTQRESNIAIGQTREGDDLYSRGLPTLRSATLYANYMYEVPDGEAGPEDDELARAAYERARLTVQTVGPIAPPATFEPVAFFAGIEALRGPAQALGWLGGSSLAELDSLLQQTGSALQAGALGQARARALNAAQLVDANSCPEFSCAGLPFTAEARALFAVNLRYLAERLPETAEPLLARAWFGLKNSDDQGTSFDIRGELYRNGALVKQGELRCVAGLTRNANQARELQIELGGSSAVSVTAGDVLALKVFARIGTNPDGTKCTGHSNAVGLRLYYDAVSRPSGFGGDLEPGAPQQFYLHGTGNSRSFDAVAPTGSTAKSSDSTGVAFSGGNPWKEVGTWNRTQP